MQFSKLHHMQRMIFRTITILLILFGLKDHANARELRIWSYEELVKASDLVAIVEPLSSESTSDNYPGHRFGLDLTDFSGNNTNFKVHTVLKGTAPPDQPLVVLHFTYSKTIGPVFNGANFAYFVPGPIQLKIEAHKNDLLIGGGTAHAHQPIWLPFLKKREDGRYEPVTDPYDSADSFRALLQSYLISHP